MEFGELSEAEFEKTAFGVENFLQSVEMYRRYRAMGREAYLIGVKKAGKIVATGLVSARNWHFGEKILRVPGGWLMDYERADYAEILAFLTEKMKVFAREKGGMLVEIAPTLISQPRDSDNNVIEGEDHLVVKAELEKLGYKYLGEQEQPKWIYVLDLTGKTEEELLMGLRMTHRRLVRRAEREGVRVRELGANELGVLERIGAETGERQGFRAPELAYYRSMKEAFGEKVRFVVAEIPRTEVRTEDLTPEDGEGEWVALAVAMFVEDRREMIYLYGGSVRHLQRYSGAYAIQWEMIKKALEMGYKRYNFYGTHPVAGNGVYAFKQGFRGHVEELLGSFALPVGWYGALYAKTLKSHEYSEIQ